MKKKSKKNIIHFFLKWLHPLTINLTYKDSVLEGSSPSLVFWSAGHQTWETRKIMKKSQWNRSDPLNAFTGRIANNQCLLSANVLGRSTRIKTQNYNTLPLL